MIDAIAVKRVLRAQTQRVFEAFAAFIETKRSASSGQPAMMVASTLRCLRGMLGLVACALALAAPVASCEGNAAPSAPLAKTEDRLVVFAASSLREAFTVLGNAFERAHPGVELTFNFAGSQDLRAQLEHGAAVDVFASADQRHMEQLVRAGHAVAPVIFARNEPVLVLAAGQAAGVRSFADLPVAERIVVGAPEVPIGRYTQQILDRASAELGADFRARVEGKVVSRELNVRQVLAKVALGEAQAGIVYRTDAAAAGPSVRILPIPAELNVIAKYPIALVANARRPELARDFIARVLARDGQETLRGAGFLPPAEGAGRP